MTLTLQPIAWQEACQFIGEVHRHHKPPQGWKFGIAVSDGEKVGGGSWNKPSRPRTDKAPTTPKYLWEIAQ